MSNMSYCRNENTAADLQDVYDHLDETENLNDYEKRGRAKIIRLAKQIAEEFGDEDE